MRRIGEYFFVVVVTLAIASIVACGEKPSQVPQRKVVNKKIEMQKQPSEQAAKPSASQVAETPPKTESKAEMDKATDEDSNATQVTSETSPLVKASLELASEYDPKGRFDPFEPLFKEDPTEPVVTSKDKRKKRVPQTPLERVAISQLKLSAVMRMSRGNSAIVEDATGKGYVIKKGTYVGLNSGQVIRIDKNRVVIEEEIENVMGELIIQNTELKLQKPAGEL